MKKSEVISLLKKGEVSIYSDVRDAEKLTLILREAFPEDQCSASASGYYKRANGNYWGQTSNEPGGRIVNLSMIDMEEHFKIGDWVRVKDLKYFVSSQCPDLKSGDVARVTELQPKPWNTHNISVRLSNNAVTYDSSGNKELKGALEKLEVLGYTTPIALFDGNVLAGAFFVQRKDGLFVPNIVGGNAYPLPKEVVEQWIPKFADTSVVINMNGLQIKLTDAGIEADGCLFTIKDLQEIVELMTDNSMSVQNICGGKKEYALKFDNVRIGCKVFSLEQIQKIIKTYKERK